MISDNYLYLAGAVFSAFALGVEVYAAASEGRRGYILLVLLPTIFFVCKLLSIVE